MVVWGKCMRHEEVSAGPDCRTMAETYLSMHACECVRISIRVRLLFLALQPQHPRQVLSVLSLPFSNSALQVR